MTGAAVAVSVVIPTYNRRSHVERAITSCLNDADVGGLTAEVLVVDDGSTDGTAEWLAVHPDPRVRAVVQANAGPQVARNRGLDLSTGTWVRFLDSDDWLQPGATALQIRAGCESGAAVVYGEAFDVFEGEEEQAFPREVMGPNLDPVAHLFGPQWVPPFCYLYSRSSLEGVRWREDIPAATEDWDFVLDVALTGAAFEHVPNRIGCYYHHQGERVGSRDSALWAAASVATIRRTVARLDQEEAWSTERRWGVSQRAYAVAASAVGTNGQAFKECIRIIRAVNPGFRPSGPGRWALSHILGLAGTERVLHLRRSLRRRLAPRLTPPDPSKNALD